MRYHRNKTILLSLMVILINIDLYAQNNEQNSGKGSILCDEQIMVDYDENDNTHSFEMKDNSVVNVVIPASPSLDQNNYVENASYSSTRKKEAELNLQEIVVGFQQYTLKDFAIKDIKSNYGVFASYGNTYLFNSTPSTLNFGFDIVFAEVGYNNYQLKYKNNTDYYHQIELGVQGGLSLVLAADESFYGKLYARYAPRYSMLYAKKKWYNSYGDYIAGGASIHISHFGVGGEFCYGTCKYLKEDNEDAPKNTNIGLRVFISYNF